MSRSNKNECQYYTVYYYSVLQVVYLFVPWLVDKRCCSTICMRCDNSNPTSFLQKSPRISPTMGAKAVVPSMQCSVDYYCPVRVKGF